MDKKVLRLVIIAMVLIMVICVLVIYSLVNIKNNEAEVTTAPPQTVEYVPIDDPIGEDGMKIHTSENGYTVKYPSGMVAKSMAKSVDFILEDDASGSSLNIVTAKNDGTVKKMTREEFEVSLSHTSQGSELLSYEEIVLNGTDAIVAEFIYMENEVKQVVVINDDFAYNITLMKSQYIEDDMLNVFEEVIKSFVLN